MTTPSLSVHQLYRRVETIGKGAYGSVHKGEHIPSGNVVALKIINLDDKSGSDDVGDIQREVALLSQLRDAPNITKYYGCYMDGPRVWIVMELAEGGSALSLMRASKNGCLEERYVAVIVREVLLGLSYLHKVPVIHRDIKAANILVAATGKVVICDFGVSALLASSSSKRNTLTGTPHWMAPELLQTLPVYDTKADIWSLGIAVYEMIRGSPPHHTLENIKVMDLIPKATPPRLGENEGGKELRDFVAMCLRESPSERLAADELSKSKWIRATAKVSVSILRDLILRLEQAAKRTSLAEPLDWEEEEERDLLGVEGDEADLWEFETVRGRPFKSDLYGSIRTPAENEHEEQTLQSTVRSAPPSNFPSSLRSIFEDDSYPPQSQRLATMQSSPQSDAPSYQSTPLPSTSTGNDRSASKRPQALGANEEQPTVKQRTFMYPPREMTRSRSKLSSSIPMSDDEDSSDNFNSMLAAPFFDDKNLSDSATKTLRVQPIPLELNAPTLFHRDGEHQDDEASPATTITPGYPSMRDPLSRSAIGRRRSKSTGEALDAQRDGDADLDLTSASTFHFPSSSNAPILSPESNPSAHDRFPPSHPGSSTQGGVQTTHQTTYSLDTSRSHSSSTRATTFSDSEDQTSRRGQINGPHLLLPFKPPNPLDKTKAVSEAFLNANSVAPGLKDVLKAGMSDLLPPSPSASAYSSRTIIPLSTSLSSSLTHRDLTDLTRRQLPGPVLDFSPAPSDVPPLLRRTVTEPLPMSSLSEGAHARNLSLGSEISPVSSYGPSLQPLDYRKLMTVDNTYVELARTIEDLTQWLSVVEAGMSGILELVSTDTIEEEHEIGSDLEETTSLTASLAGNLTSIS
ncbi:hypothetical protein H0H93_008620 [Arthromyces matolae]|nr:hypothetical protein H0H93_008620 [Arthromyces matolae]